ARSCNQVLRSAEDHHARRTPADRLARAVSGDPAFPKIGHALHHRTAGSKGAAPTLPSCSRRTSSRHPPTFRGGRLCLFDLSSRGRAPDSCNAATYMLGLSQLWWLAQWVTLMRGAT